MSIGKECGNNCDGPFGHADGCPVHCYCYDDSQRLDELATAEDYNRFEEEQVAHDNDLGGEGS